MQSNVIRKYCTACFLSAVQEAATKLGKKEVGAQAVVHADVTLGQPKDHPDFGLKVMLRVEGVEDQAILDTAHQVSYTVAIAAGTNGLILIWIDVSIQPRFAGGDRNQS
jgi:organic hydroperoxide reductase OsmC/OhrA